MKPNGRPKIIVEQLTKIFQRLDGTDLEVLKGIDLVTVEGEFVSITGSSGCGKTTFLNIIGGLLPLTEGVVKVDGRPVQGPGRDRGFIFQQDVVFMWRTVLRNVEYGMEIRGIDAVARKRVAMEYLRLVNLEKFADFYPKELSGGMRKRVAIAMVFANDPEVLLMDEPFGSLDYPTKIELQNKLLEIWDRDKKTTLFVTHDLEEALFLSDRVVVLSDGKIAKTLEISWGRPRSNELRESREFSLLKTELWRYIR